MLHRGSPPHMRGKVHLGRFPHRGSGITPAYAGKRHHGCCGWRSGRDHPRICGEKPQRKPDTYGRQGSPPRMRGKEVDGFGLARGLGITPAYAGKSARVDERGQGRKDHPRICREKKCPKAWCIGQQGSPPRMRGKVSVKEVKNAIKRITPAYAGKRKTTKYRGEE